MGNGPFIDGLPFLKMVDLSMAMLNNQMVVISSLRLALWLRILHTALMAQNFPHEYRI